MILEELIGDAKFTVVRNGKPTELKIGDSFTDEEYQTRVVYGEAGKAVVRVDQNCTVEIKAIFAPQSIVSEPAPAPAPKTTTAPAPSQTEETPSE